MSENRKSFNEKLEDYKNQKKEHDLYFLVRDMNKAISRSVENGHEVVYFFLEIADYYSAVNLRFKGPGTPETEKEDYPYYSLHYEYIHTMIKNHGMDLPDLIDYLARHIDLENKDYEIVRNRYAGVPESWLEKVQEQSCLHDEIIKEQIVDKITGRRKWFK